MSKRDMAARLREDADGIPKYCNNSFYCRLMAGAAALEREADAEEKAKPKVTLENQIHRLNWLSGKLLAGSVRGGNAADAAECDAAAETIRRLDEDGGRWRHHLQVNRFDLPSIDAILESLGVEPKP